MADRADITPELLRQLLRYEPETGKLFWLERQNNSRFNTTYSGKEAFTATKDTGHKHGSIFRCFFTAHRVAWAIYYGCWPEFSIDHIDGDPSNNKIHNLRDVSPSINSKNLSISASNTSGFTGVSKSHKKWLAYIRVDYKRYDLGRFSDITDAIAARKEAERKYNFHSNHGRQQVSD